MCFRRCCDWIIIVLLEIERRVEKPHCDMEQRKNERGRERNKTLTKLIVKTLNQQQAIISALWNEQAVQCNKHRLYPHPILIADIYTRTYIYILYIMYIKREQHTLGRNTKTVKVSKERFNKSRKKIRL